MSENGVSKLVVQHRNGPNYVSVVATGVSAAGPSGDGLLHLSFHTDALRVVQETFDRKDISDDSGREAMELSGAKAETEMFREQLVAVRLPMHVAKQFLEILKSHPGLVDG